LRTLLIGIGLASVALFLLVVSPPLLTTILLITLWAIVATFLTAVVVYKRGGARAFGIGALFPTGATVLALTWMLAFWLLASYEATDVPKLVEHLERLAFPLRVWSVAAGLLCVVCGFVCVAALAYFARQEP